MRSSAVLAVLAIHAGHALAAVCGSDNQGGLYAKPAPCSASSGGWTCGAASVGSVGNTFILKTGSTPVNVDIRCPKGVSKVSAGASASCSFTSDCPAPQLVYYYSKA
ncbi:hypothetical protein E4U42_006377 [Claviceps africana]|uniref:Uncharacterized protein n=1 Tax=Claviceps africana TaxID=83212 RepID=A0A8K0J4I0_9HYPO|nr:hypothetical protein E4U42_006377 [Claviceps africana]